MEFPLFFLLPLQQRLRTSAVVLDLGRFVILAAHSRTALAAENLFLRKQLALFKARRVKPRRAHDSVRWVMAALSRMFQWRGALVNVKPDYWLSDA